MIPADKRLNKLQFNFPEGWKDISDENPDGPPTFIDDSIEESGVLQISTAEYVSGAVPSPGASDLIELSKNAGLQNEFGILRYEESGKCGYGQYGFAEFSRIDFPYITMWHLSDGKNFIFATFICSVQPDQKMVNDVKAILTSIRKKSFFAALFRRS